MGFFGGGGGGGTTPVNMTGASTGAAGTAGYVPAPAAGKSSRALFSDANFSEIPLLPQYATASTNFVLSYMVNDAQGNGTIGNTRRRIFALTYIPVDSVVGTLSFRTGSASPTSINCHFAIWDCGNDGLPSTYITGGTVSAGTTVNADISVSVSTAAIKRGFSYISLTPESALPANALTVNTPSTNSIYNSFIGNSAVAGSNAYVFAYTATTYSQTTHETFTVLNSTYPKVGLKYA